MLAERTFYFYAIFTAMQCAAAINLSAELHIVVAGSGLPHFKHVDRVVVVCQPAFTSKVELTVFSLVQEYGLLTGLNGYVDTDHSEILLDCFTDLNITFGIVGQVSHVDRGICGKHAAFIEFIASAL